MPHYLFTIPHYFSQPTGGAWHGSKSGREKWRAAVLRETVLTLHQTFGESQCMMQLHRGQSQAANSAIRGSVRVVICTTGDAHLLEQLQLPRGMFEHQACEDPPAELGYACHRVMKERLEQAEWFGYLEDDLYLADSFFFRKLAWFADLAGDDAVLLPNRFEVNDGTRIHRAYVDGDLRTGATQRWQDVTLEPVIEAAFLNEPVRFVRARNPHSGCFFLRREQLRQWASKPYFLDRSQAFIGPLESAATLGVMRTFRVYKPAIENAGFLEVEHQSKQFIKLLRPKP